MAEPILMAKRVSFSYGDRHAIADVSLDVREHELVAIVGPNGSGKSTLCRLLAGLRAPDAGAVQIEGSDVVKYNARARARFVAYLPQDLQVPFETSVLELVLLGRLSWQAGLALASDDDTTLAERALEFVGIADLAARPYGALSGGERRRAAIAMVIAQSARLLVLDEPANALDLRHAWDLLLRLRRDRRSAVIVVHDLALAASCFDRALLLAGGRVVAFDTPDRALTEATIEVAYGIPVHRVATSDGARAGFLPRPP
ncbi:MAG: ABC transporter ATP-binding protein [Deltaproteobacteria bacterium]|nr:ABC transporter ATP-binding protein [Deltaproteobacteria bacterium]